MDSATTLMAGVGIGVSLAAPIGPMAILLINRTLSGGLRAGLCTGAGSSTVHVILSVAVLLGMNRTAQWFAGNRAVLTGGGALLLLAFACRLWIAGNSRSRMDRGGRTMARHYLSAMMVSLTNPILLILLFAAFATVLERPPASGVEEELLVGGVFAGSFLWWVGLSTVIALLGSRISDRAAAVITKLMAVGMGAFALERLAPALGIPSW